MICFVCVERGSARTLAGVYSLATVLTPPAREAGGKMKSRAGSPASTREINAILAQQCPESRNARATADRGTDGHESSTRLVPSIILSARIIPSTLFWDDNSAKNLSGDSDAIQTVSVKNNTAITAAQTRLVFPHVSPNIKRPPPGFVFHMKYYHETAIYAKYRGFLRIFPKIT
jgi:hypothetical protein